MIGTTDLAHLTELFIALIEKQVVLDQAESLELFLIFLEHRDEIFET
jgi:hypothetical protein